MTTYRLESMAGDQWSIVDGLNETVFVGTLPQCEDWLDSRENGRDGTANWLFWLDNLCRDVWHQLLTALGHGPQPPMDPGPTDT